MAGVDMKTSKLVQGGAGPETTQTLKDPFCAVLCFKEPPNVLSQSELIARYRERLVAIACVRA